MIELNYYFRKCYMYSKLKDMRELSTCFFVFILFLIPWIFFPTETCIFFHVFSWDDICREELKNVQSCNLHYRKVEYYFIIQNIQTDIIHANALFYEKENACSTMADASSYFHLLFMAPLKLASERYLSTTWTRIMISINNSQRTKWNWDGFEKLWWSPIFNWFMWLEFEHHRLQEHASHP